MTKYLAGVLTVIAVGVLLIAYGLLTPRTTVDALTMQPAIRGMVSGDGAVIPQPVSLQQPVSANGAGYAAPAFAAAPVAVAYIPQPAQVVSYVPASQPVYASPTPAVQAPRPVQTVSYEPVRRVRTSDTRIVERQPRRDWKKTAMVIGGSSAAGAGLGGIFGGKKGALIGAAIGGGASTIYETVKH